MCHLVDGGQLLAVGCEGDEAAGQVDEAADLHVAAGAARRGEARRVRAPDHVAVAPLDTDRSRRSRGERSQRTSHQF